jgi:hypothetical protein
MKLGQDNVLWPFCIRGKTFCPNSASAKGVTKDMTVTEKEEPSSEDGPDSEYLKVQQS